MSKHTRFATRGTFSRAAFAGAIAAMLATPASACDLDGLSHGYGPMSALFAGAHGYQSLNGVEEDAPPEDAKPSDAESGASVAPPSDAPASPRRSFVAWAKAKPKPEGDPASTEAPAAWTRVSAPRPPDAPADTAPEAREASERSN